MKGTPVMKSLKKFGIITFILCVTMALCAMTALADWDGIAYGAGTVDATSLNIRSGPSTDSDRVGVVSRGTIVVILEVTNDEWYRVNYNGTIGYVSAGYLTDILTAENFSATGTVKGTDVRMRTSPSTDGDVITTYTTGDTLSVIGINNGWYKISDTKGTGYIRSDLMDIVDGGPTYTSSTTGSSTLGQRIANYALQYVGYNYVYGAQSPSTGFDCSGLVYYVYGQFGYSLQRTASQQYANNGVSVSKSELQQGDLVFFSSNGYSVTHVGMYIGDGHFVHASTSKTGVIISDLYSDYYTRNWFGAKRII